MNIDDLKKEMGEDYDKILPTSPNTLIHLGFRGSIAFGTYVPNSQLNSIDDKDIMGVYIAPKNHYLGFGGPEHKTKFIGCWDSICYELRKFFRLLLKSNPNVLGQLWLPKDRIVLSTPIWDHIIDNKDIFISKHAYKSFAGYANGQLHRMTHMNFEGYMGIKRRKIVKRFGYDTKNASHLIRLLRMCIEFLNTGEMQVDRTYIDAEELVSIKEGKFKLEEIKEMSNDLFEQAKQAKEKSDLPEKPDRDKIENLLVDILHSYSV